MIRAKEGTYVLFNGNTYTLDKSSGYRRATRRDVKLYLHREMWIAANGPIPAGHDVHHKDDDKSHNELSNFECLTHPNHASVHSLTEIEPRKCVQCDSPIPRRIASSGTAKTPWKYQRRKYCTNECRYADTPRLLRLAYSEGRRDRKVS